MKKLAFLTSALLALNLMASAAVENIRLELRIAPKNSFAANSTTKVLRVLEDGIVYRAEIDSATGEVISRTELVSIPIAEVAGIDSLIEEARDGRIFTEHHDVHCMAVSLTQAIYSADNGNVFLRQASMCVDPTFNTSRAAVRLVSILDALERKAVLKKVVSLSCHNLPLLMDAGYQISILTDPARSVSDAYLGEQSLIGPRHLGYYQVHSHSADNQVSFDDVTSQGANFHLIVALKEPLSDGGYRSHFVAKTLQGKTVEGALSCSFPAKP